MKSYYEHKGITIYCGDCLEIMPELEPVDLCLTDPPYGINLNTDNSRFSGGTAENMAKRGNRPGTGGGKLIIGDDKPFDPTPLISFKNVIIWGFNHFAQKLPAGTSLVWIKRLDRAFGSFLSDAEIAWMKGGYGVYCKRDLSLNKIAKTRTHPTQKPVSLMMWCIGFLPPAGTILDPFMGREYTGRICK
jgi:DNA modification methylase